MSRHFTAMEMADYARGLIAGSEGESLLQHCKECAQCGDQLAAILVLRRAKAAGHPLLSTRQRSRVSRKRWLAAAAGVVGIGVLAVGAQVLRPGVEPDASTARSALPPPSAEEPAGVAALATTEPLSPLTIKIHTDGPISAGGAGSPDWLPRMNAAGSKIVNHDYGGAVADLEGLYAEDPTSQLAAAYLGIARYLYGDNSSEVGALLARGATGNSESIARFAQWYLANYVLRSEQDMDSAREILNELATNSDWPGRRAQTLLERIEALGT